MTKQEFLAASLPYGQKCYHFDGSRETEHICLIAEYRHDEFTIADNEQEYYLELKDMIPIIRPLDSLIKECIQSDYNEGKPFIPIVELAKIAEPYSRYEKIISFSNQMLKKLNSYSVVFYNRGGLGEMYFEYIVDEATFCMIDENGKRLVHNQFRLFQLLLKWHFWPNMPEGEEVVYVTDDFNPYK